MEAESCACSWDGEGAPEFFDARQPRARKDHVCCECHEVIRAGDVYEYVVGKWEGDWSAHKTCATCVLIRRDYGGCAAFGYLREELRNALGFDYVTGEWETNHVSDWGT